MLRKTEGSKRRYRKKKKINGISAKIGDTVMIRVGRSKQRTGVVFAVSKNGTVKLRQYRKWSKLLWTIDGSNTISDNRERDSEKKIRSRTESSVEVSQRTLPTDVSMEKMIDTASIKIGDTVRIKIGKSKTKTGIVSAVSKKGTVKLHKYGMFSAVVRVIQCNTTNGNNWEGDSEKKKVTDRILCQSVPLFTTKE